MYRDILRENTKRCSVFIGVVCFACTNLFPNLRHCGRHKGREQCRDNPNGVEQVVQNGCQTSLLAFVLCQNPRCSFVDVLICTGNNLEDFSQSMVQLCLIHKAVYLFPQSGCCCNQIIIKFASFSVFRQCAIEILVHHGNRTGNQVAQTVCKVGIDSGNQNFVGERAVRTQSHFSEDVIPNRICTIAFAQYKRVYDIAQRFTHFLPIEGNPAMNC